MTAPVEREKGGRPRMPRRRGNKKIDARWKPKRTLWHSEIRGLDSGDAFNSLFSGSPYHSGLIKNEKIADRNRLAFNVRGISDARIEEPMTVMVVF